MNKQILITATILGATGVVLGALGAHALGKLITEAMQQTFEIGVRYQMYHALFLLFVGLAPNTVIAHKKAIFYTALFGVVLFSVSIYFLATNALTSFDFKTIGFVTPIGGVLLIISWCLLLVNLLKLGRKAQVE